MGFRQYTQFILQSEFLRNAGKLVSSNVLAQAIGLLCYPILTRIYTPSDFGLLNLFISIGSFLVLISTAEYHYAIALPKEEEKAVACFHAGGLILLVTCVLCIIASFFSESIATLFNTPSLANIFPLMVLFVGFTGLWNLLNYWLIRNKEFNRISTFQLALSGGNVVSKYALGKAGFLHTGLVWGAVVGQIIAVTSCLMGKSRHLLTPLFHTSRQDTISMARTYRKYPLYSLPRVLLNSINNNLPILLLTPVFGTAQLGLFGMAVTLSFRPINMVVSSFYQVFLQHNTDKVHHHKSIVSTLRRFTLYTALVTLPCFTLLYFILPSLTAWLLGEEWRTTGEYIRWMLPWLALTLLVSPMGHLTDLFMKQNWWLGFEIFSFALRITALFWGMYQGSITTAIAGYCLAGVASYLVQIPCFIRIITLYERRL